MNDLTFVAPHRISSAQFARVLERAHSPAAPDAAALADIPTDYGIDRAVALAFFAHESSFGTQGICASEDTKNWGNVRRPYSASAAELITPPGRGPFAKYPTWIAGLDDWCKRIRYTYVEAWKLATVGAALARYAPTTDHNDPARYAAAAAQLVAQWQAEDTSPMLLKLAITDLRAKLPRKNWEIGRRHGNHPTSITLHYNGSKPVPPERQRGEGVLTQLKIDADWQTREGWSNTAHGADGLQYHLIIDADGRIYQARDLDSCLCTARNADCNAHSLAIHLLVGGPKQDATPTMWQSFTHLCDVLIATYGMANRTVVKGHQEWASTDCPGPLLMHRLLQWRSGLPVALPGRYEAVRATEAYTAPDGKTIAWNGTAHIPAGMTLEIDAVADDWAHWPPAGFIPLDDLEAR